MAALEDKVGALYQGTPKVSVPKGEIEPLSGAWTKSKINLPHKGSKASYRNGRLHAHDMGDYFEVHLDRVDPDKQAVQHLIEDAPLVFWFWTGFSFASHSASGLQDRHKESWLDTWGIRIALGLILVALGIVIGTDPFRGRALAFLALVLATSAIAVLSLYKAAKGWKRGKGRSDLWMGIFALVMTAVLIVFPNTVMVIMFLALTVWTMGSALFLLFGRGEKLLQPRDSLIPIILGLLSLGMAISLLVWPSQAINLVFFLAAVLIIFIGAMQVLAGLLIWSYGRKVRPGS